MIFNHCVGLYTDVMVLLSSSSSTTTRNSPEANGSIISRAAENWMREREQSTQHISLYLSLCQARFVELGFLMLSNFFLAAPPPQPRTSLTFNINWKLTSFLGLTLQNLASLHCSMLIQDQNFVSNERSFPQCLKIETNSLISLLEYKSSSSIIIFCIQINPVLPLLSFAFTSIKFFY